MKVQAMKVDDATLSGLPEVAVGKQGAVQVKEPSQDNSPAPAEQRSGDRVTLSPIWAEVAVDIDVKKATSEEIATLSKRLYEARAITFEDHVELSFNVEGDQPQNFLDHWQARQDSAVRYGAQREELEGLVRIQSILGFVDSLGVTT